jgi:hypothetical protein
MPPYIEALEVYKLEKKMAASSAIFSDSFPFKTWHHFSFGFVKLEAASLFVISFSFLLSHLSLFRTFSFIGYTYFASAHVGSLTA